jgi:hypothetical protein
MSFGSGANSSCLETCALFAWLINHQPAVLFSQNKPATSNQPAVLFSQNKPTLAINRPTEQADGWLSGGQTSSSISF